jgi:hypothetical protein
MLSMGADEKITLAALGQPERHAGHVVSLHGLVAELQMDDPSLMPPGTLVEFQNRQTLWLGEVLGEVCLAEVQPGVESAAKNALRVRLEHSLDLEKLAWIQKCWNAGPPE